MAGITAESLAGAYDLSDPILAEAARFIEEEVGPLRYQGVCIAFVGMWPKPIVVLLLSDWDTPEARSLVYEHFRFPDALRVTSAAAEAAPGRGSG